MNQGRRDFIKKGLLFTAAVSSPLLISKSLEFVTAEDPKFTVADLMGKGNPSLFGKDYKLLKEAHQSLVSLSKEANKAGFRPQILSSYRNFAHQKRIWDNKYVKFTKEEKLSPQTAIQKIIAYSTIPGTSRHHWGTDFDIIDGSKGVATNPLNEKHFNKGGVYHDFKLWMNENAENFGFYEVYTNVKGRKGFKYEPWHFSYLPIACEMMRAYLDKNIVSELYALDIKGSEHFTNEFIATYFNENIMDINPDLIP